MGFLNLVQLFFVALMGAFTLYYFMLGAAFVASFHFFVFIVLFGCLFLDLK